MYGEPKSMKPLLSGQAERIIDCGTGVSPVFTAETAVPQRCFLQNDLGRSQRPRIGRHIHHRRRGSS